MRGGAGGSLPVAQLGDDPQRCALRHTVHRLSTAAGSASRVVGKRKRDTVCRWKEGLDVRLQSTLRVCLVRTLVPGRSADAPGSRGTRRVGESYQQNADLEGESVNTRGLVFRANAHTASSREQGTARL